MFKSKYLFLDYIAMLFALFTVLTAIIYQENPFIGLFKIITSKSLLTVDYIAIAGISGAIFNALLLLILNLFLIKHFKIKVRGAVFAAIFIVLGFSFFGKNIVNILPIYFGVYLYSLTEKQSFSRYFVIALFATGLSPVVSVGFGTSVLTTIIGVVIGVVYGFIIPTFSAHVIRFHGGYTLYNIGFAGGIFLVTYGVLNLFGVKYEQSTLVSNDYSLVLIIILLVISLFFLALSFTRKSNKKSYRKLLSMSGRAVTDFTMIFDEAITFRNISFLGFICTAVIVVLDITCNGVVFGAAITVMGFGTFGKHPRNVIPVMAGVLLTGFFLLGGINENIIVIAFFATALAPIAGDFGPIAGVVAGIIHVGIVTRSNEWQGGLNLYNNGFATGFVAALMSSILDTVEFKKILQIRKGESNET